MFEGLKAPLWAEKAATEIARIGVRRAPEELTEGEERVAELAAQGLTNPEIAARLFMSRRTVEANLARAYRKLGFRSRAELGIRSRAELGATMAKRRATGVHLEPAPHGPFTTGATPPIVDLRQRRII
jgi:DNA-binding CsgD family transcriptional regulator